MTPEHSSTTEKLRVFVLTDIENEPDDAQSLVRFLTYCNQWDVEGLVATTSVHQKNQTAAWRIREIVEAYGQVQDNLLLHESDYPTAEYLLNDQVLRRGQPPTNPQTRPPLSSHGQTRRARRSQRNRHHRS